MSAQTEDQDVSQANWFDPFPEPHTIPSGWDLSELFPDPQTVPLSDTAPGADVESR